jgi:hypothetical protein
MSCGGSRHQRSRPGFGFGFGFGAWSVWAAQRPVNDWRTGNCVADAWQRRGRSEAGLHLLSDGTVLTNPRTSGPGRLRWLWVHNESATARGEPICGVGPPGPSPLLPRPQPVSGGMRSIRGVGGPGRGRSGCGYNRSATYEWNVPATHCRARPSFAWGTTGQRRNGVGGSSGWVAGAGSVPDWATTDQRRSGVGASEAVRQGRGRAGSHCGHDRSATERAVDPRRERRRRSGPDGRIQPIGDGMWRADSRCRWPSPARSRLSHNRSATEWCGRMAGRDCRARAHSRCGYNRSATACGERIRVWGGRGRGRSCLGHTNQRRKRTVDSQRGRAGAGPVVCRSVRCAAGGMAACRWSRIAWGAEPVASGCLGR